MPKFKRGGAGTPAIMSVPSKPEPPVADPAGVKGARASAASTVAAPPAAVDPDATETKDRNSDKRKPGRPRKSAAAPPEKDA
jgi:hypothetical protein